MALTDTWLKAHILKAHTKVIEKTDRAGLFARVSKKGKIVFHLRYLYNHKQHRIDLGSYPLISLKTARENALKCKASVEQGYDPRLLKKTARAQILAALTLQQLFLKWYDAFCVPNKQGAFEIRRSFEIYVLPKLGQLPVDDISADTWLTLFEQVKPKAPSIALRLLNNARQMLAWAVRRKLIADNVLVAISARQDLGLSSQATTRTLSDTEITGLLKCLEHSRIADKNRLFIKLCLIYGCRNGELRQARKADFDFDKMIWTVPPAHHKTGKKTGQPLIRPITPGIKILLEACFKLNASSYAFTNAGSNEPMGRTALLSLPYHVMQWLRKNEGVAMPHWSIHDLRRTFRTQVAVFTDPHIAELMLGHSLKGTWGVYDRYDYLKEQAECLEKWQCRLVALGLNQPEHPCCLPTPARPQPPINS